jgi:hypothetical protein
MQLKNRTISNAFICVLLTVFLSSLGTISYSQVSDTNYEVVDTVVSPTTTVTDADEEEVYEDEETYVAPEVRYFEDKNSELEPVGFNSERRLSLERKRSLSSDEDFWYANYKFEKKKPKESNRGNGNVGSVLRTVLWVVIIGAFIGFLVLFLTNSNVGLFRRNRSIASTENDENNHEDIFAINYQVEIDKAIGQQNYRLAVRLLFLRLLRTLSDRNVIQYKQDLTNVDYLKQLQGTRWYTEFFTVARNYEYTWYGQFPLSQEKFSVIKKEFDQLDSKLGRQ